MSGADAFSGDFWDLCDACRKLNGLMKVGERFLCRSCLSAPSFTCECCKVDGRSVSRRLYLVTGNGGEVSTCSYCDECADLARMDYNGETAEIVLLETDMIAKIERTES